MGRKSYSSFYNWVKKKAGFSYTEKGVSHPEYWVSYHGASSEFELLNDNTEIAITDRKTGLRVVYALPEKVVRIDINPFSSGRNAAKDLFFESEARDKINAWLDRLIKAGLDVRTGQDNNQTCSE
jgi:hypothetical protein